MDTPNWKKFIWFVITKYKKLTYGARSFAWRLAFPGSPKNLRVLGAIKTEVINNIILGDNVTINHGCYLHGRGVLKIGSNSHLSPYVMINTGLLDVSDPDRLHKTGDVSIGDDVWLATNVIVNPGVKIGNGVVVGSGAVVTRDLPEYTLCLGVPAKAVKEIPKAKVG